MGCFPIVYLGWFDFAMDFGLEQPPRSSYADLPSYMPYMSHLSTCKRVGMVIIDIYQSTRIIESIAKQGKVLR
jgi:hypothetical protein